MSTEGLAMENSPSSDKETKKRWSGALLHAIKTLHSPEMHLPYKVDREDTSIEKLRIYCVTLVIEVS